MEAWADTLRRVINRAVDLAELKPIADVDQLVFEIRALLDGANTDSLLTGSAEPYARVRTALKRLLP
jgi:hypothetical protein